MKTHEAECKIQKTEKQKKQQQKCNFLLKKIRWMSFKILRGAGDTSGVRERFACLHAYLHACMRAGSYACMCACVHASIRACMHACLCACACVCTWNQTVAHACTTFVQTCTRACVHAGISPCPRKCMRTSGAKHSLPGFGRGRPERWINGVTFLYNCHV